MPLSTLGPRISFLQCPWFPLYTSTLWKLLVLDTTRALPLSLCSTSYLYSRLKIIGLVFQLPNASQEEGNPPEQMRSQSSCCLSVTTIKSRGGNWSFRLCFSQTYAGIGFISQKSVSIREQGRVQKQPIIWKSFFPSAQVVAHISETLDVLASLLVFPYLLPSFL